MGRAEALPLPGNGSGVDAVTGPSLVPAATGTATSSATPSNASPIIGQQIEVTINIDVSGVNSPDNKLGGFTGTLDWNPAVLSYSSNTGIGVGFTGNVNTSNVADGHIVFNGANAGGATGSLNVLTITFDVKAAGTSPLNLDFSAMAAATTFASLLPILTITDGQVDASVPPAVSDLAVSRVGSIALLTWTHLGSDVTRYEVWRSSDPYFTPGDEGSEKRGEALPPDSGSQGSYPDTDALGTAGTSYFYVVLPVSASVIPYPPSNQVGVVNFALVPGGQ